MGKDIASQIEEKIDGQFENLESEDDHDVSEDVEEEDQDNFDLISGDDSIRSKMGSKFTTKFAKLMKYFLASKMNESVSKKKSEI